MEKRKIASAAAARVGEILKIDTEARLLQCMDGEKWHIILKDGDLQPVICIEEVIEDAESVPAIVEKVTDFVKESYCNRGGSVANLTREDIVNYENAKTRIVYRLIGGTERRKGFLKSIPHRAYFDMQIVYCVAFSESMSSYITDGLMQVWGVTEEDLYTVAAENTPILFPQIIRPLQFMPTGENAYYLITNSTGAYGAAACLYPNVLRIVADRIGGDFYLIPSSVHEMLALPTWALSKDAVDDMIRSINEQEVAEKDWLSDHCYIFDKDGKPVAK